MAICTWNNNSERNHSIKTCELEFFRKRLIGPFLTNETLTEQKYFETSL